MIFHYGKVEVVLPNQSKNDKKVIKIFDNKMSQFFCLQCTLLQELAIYDHESQLQAEFVITLGMSSHAWPNPPEANN